MNLFILIFKEAVMKKMLFSAVAFLLLWALALLALEGVLRFYNLNGKNYDIEMWKYSKYLKRKSENPLIGIEHIPLKGYQLQNVLVKTNSWGFRDREYVIPKPQDVYRIVVLGSSVTLGWGVPEEQTYIRLAEKWLGGKTGRKKVEMINTAVGNYNTVREVESFFAKGVLLDPDMVILTFFINDPQVLAIKENPLLKHSQLAVLLWSRYQQLVRRIGLRENYETYYKNLYSDQNPGWGACLEAVRKLAVFCQSRQIPMLWAMVPEIHNLQNYPFGFVHQIIQEKAAAEGFRFLDFYDVLKSEDASQLWAMRGDPHPNTKGHQLMAQYLYDDLLKMKPWERR